MAADFPNSPSVGQVYTLGNSSWTWTGGVWQSVPITTYITDPFVVNTAAATGTLNIDCITANTYKQGSTGTPSTASFVLNFRGNATTTLNNAFNADNRITVMTFINQTGAATTSYPTAIQIDGTVTGVTTFWQGGTAPTAGNASARDTYTFEIIRTASATWEIYASQTKYA
jgi:hypothetical protein